MILLSVIIMITGIATQSDNLQETYLEVLTPPEQVSTNLDRLYIVGKTNAGELSFFLNGNPAGQIKVDDSIFHFHLHYGYGLNEVSIAAQDMKDGVVRNITRTLEILYSPTVSRKISRYYPAHVFHVRKPRTVCTGCHQYESDTTGLITAAQNCYECHIHTKETFKTHIPNDTLACVNCHRVKTDLSYELGSAYYRQNNPCYTCHEDKIGDFNAEYIHGPVAGGGCVICHNPHGSDFQPTLNEPEEVLCLSCHTEVDNARRYEIQHQPFAEGKCVSCHDPHATNHRWVLVKDSEEICLKCHEDLDFHQHPYNVKPKRRLATDLKLADSGNLECISCHNPHASNSEHLLRVENIVTCYGCHPDR